MATIINNPSPAPGERSSATGSGVIVGVLLVLLLLIALVAFGFFRSRVPARSGTNINVPDKIQIDLNKGPQQ